MTSAAITRRTVLETASALVLGQFERAANGQSLSFCKDTPAGWWDIDAELFDQRTQGAGGSRRTVWDTVRVPYLSAIADAIVRSFARFAGREPQEVGRDHTLDGVLHVSRSGFTTRAGGQSRAIIELNWRESPETILIVEHCFSWQAFAYRSQVVEHNSPRPHAVERTSFQGYPSIYMEDTAGVRGEPIAHYNLPLARTHGEGAFLWTPRGEFILGFAFTLRERGAAGVVRQGVYELAEITLRELDQVYPACSHPNFLRGAPADTLEADSPESSQATPTRPLGTRRWFPIVKWVTPFVIGGPFAYGVYKWLLKSYARMPAPECTAPGAESSALVPLDTGDQSAPADHSLGEDEATTVGTYWDTAATMYEDEDAFYGGLEFAGQSTEWAADRTVDVLAPLIAYGDLIKGTYNFVKGFSQSFVEQVLHDNQPVECKAWASGIGLVLWECAKDGIIEKAGLPQAASKNWGGMTLSGVSQVAAKNLKATFATGMMNTALSWGMDLVKDKAKKDLSSSPVSSAPAYDFRDIDRKYKN